MTTNPYFRNYTHNGQQDLIESLIIESIRMHGMNVFYLPRTIGNRDDVFREDENTSFNAAYEIEVYIKNINKWGGDGKFLAQAGLEIRDEVNFVMAIRTFKETIGRPHNISRPNEGDLIYFPLNGKAFQINFVDHETIFYQMGKLQIYDLSCHLFEQNAEHFATGVPEIDVERIYAPTNTNMLEWGLLTHNGEALLTSSGALIVRAEYGIDTIDPNAQNKEFQDEGNIILDFDETDPFSSGTY